MNTKHDRLTNTQVPLPTTAVLIGMGLIWAWVSDGPCRGARWPFIYIGAFTTVSKNIITPCKISKSFEN